MVTVRLHQVWVNSQATLCQGIGGNNAAWHEHASTDVGVIVVICFLAWITNYDPVHLCVHFLPPPLPSQLRHARHLKYRWLLSRGQKECWYRWSYRSVAGLLITPPAIPPRPAKPPAPFCRVGCQAGGHILDV